MPTIRRRSPAIRTSPFRSTACAVAGDGFLGEVAPRHLSFMGSNMMPDRLSTQFAPAAVALLAGDGLDIALLVPV